VSSSHQVYVLSVRRAALCCGYLSRAEKGDLNLTIRVLAALAENLNVNIRELFFE
jgi:transcriptional regulator with XRE-family HTH domain